MFPLVQSRWQSLTLNKNAEKSIRKSYAPIDVKPQGRGGGGGLSRSQEIVLFQKISILPSRRVFGWNPPPPIASGSLGSHFPLKILTFQTPLPLGISKDPPWGGYGYFLEPHIDIQGSPMGRDFEHTQCPNYLTFSEKVTLGAKI